MIKNYLLALVLSMASCFYTLAQVPTNGDCLGAIPVCNSVYSYSSSANGPGNYTDLPYQGPASNNYCPTNCISVGEQNSTWYIFTTQTAGNINFTITPVDMSDDYDWALYNITTGSGCTGIYSGGMQVSCNYCANPGTTGPNQANALYCNGPNSCSSYNKVIPTAAGQTYALFVDNFTGSFNGYTINFGASTAGIVDNVRPYMTWLQTPVSCGANTLTIRFNENIRCNSITGSDFTLTGPGGPYTISYVSGAACNVGGTFEDEFVLTVIPDMTTAGTYTLWLSGAVMDNCGNLSDPANVNNTRTFTITAPTTSVTASPNPVCAGSSTTLTASGASTYSWSHGLGTGASKVVTPAATTTYTVVGTLGACNVGASVTVNVTPAPVGAVFANPINFGTLTCQTYTDVQNNCTGNCFGHEYGQASHDIYYRFTLAQAATVDISHCASSFDTYMHLLNSGGGLITSVDDNGPLCVGTRASISTSLAAGTYYVVSEGYGSNCGTLSTQISFPTPSGSITASAASVCQGANVTFNSTTTSGTWSTFQYQWDGTGGAWTNWTTANPYVWPSGNGGHTLYVRGVYTNGPCTAYSNIVSVYVAAPTNAGSMAAVPASVCVGAGVNFDLTAYVGTFDYFQYQWDGTGGAWTNWANTDPYVWTASNPGHTLYVRGVVTSSPCATAYSAPVGVYITPTPVGATQGNPINVGTLTCSSYSNTQNNSTVNCFGHEIGNASDDIYYSFTLTAPTIVTISHCGSGFDTYMRLLDNLGTQLYFNDDYGPICATAQASMQPTLPAGTYYVVSEGYSTYSGNIITQISVPAPSGGSISGPDLVCYGSSGVVYTITGATNAATYNWSVPAGASITAGQGTSSITVNWGTASSGSVSCIPTNGPCVAASVSRPVTVMPATCWIGVTSTDWFTASNWCLNGNIPLTTTDVIIPNAILTPNDPNIYAVGAVCRNMTIQAGGIVNITGTNPLSVYGNWSDAGVFNEANGVVNFTGSALQQISSTETFYDLNINNAAGVNITAPVNISHQLTLTSGALSHSGNLSMGNNTTIERFTGSLATAPVFNTAVNLVYRSTVNSGPEIPAGATILRNMTLNTAANGIVTLTTPATLNTNLSFVNGALRSSVPNPFIFADNSTYSGAANLRFIDGPVSKIGDDAFEFPTGDIAGATWVWAPLAIADPGSSASDRFTVEYYFTASPNNWSPLHMCNLAQLNHTSGVEYWNIERNIGTTYPDVTLFWKDAQRSGINSLPDLTTAHWEDCAGTNKWVSKGGTATGTLGPGGTGQITGTGFPSYSPVTFGARLSSNNPLPIDLISFNVQCRDEKVWLSWATASETDNDFFSVERSSDMLTWELLGTVDGAGSSNSVRMYSFTDDQPLTGLAYYRLLQTDFNGTVYEFSPQTTDCGSASGQPGFTLYPNPTDDVLFVELFNTEADKLEISIYDDIGNLVFIQEYQEVNAPNRHVKIDMAQFAVGVYCVRIQQGSFSGIGKVIRQSSH